MQLCILYTIVGYLASYVPVSTMLSDAYKYIYMRNNLVKVPKTKNKYELDYYYQGTNYKIFVRINKGPSLVVKVTDEYAKDVTSEIKAYMGPNENFHGATISPNDLGYNQLTFHIRSGSKISFANIETITI